MRFGFPESCPKQGRVINKRLIAESLTEPTKSQVLDSGRITTHTATADTAITG